MYKESSLLKDSSPQAQPEHLHVAKTIANEVTDRFSPTEQNELIKTIYEIIKERRVYSIKEAKERYEFLQASLNELG